MSQPFATTTTAQGLTLAVHGSLDINTAPALAEEIDRIVAQKPRAITVDLGALDLIDSSGVAALVKLYKAIKAGGGTITMTGARDQPLAIFKLLKMDRVFGL